MKYLETNVPAFSNKYTVFTPEVVEKHRYGAYSGSPIPQYHDQWVALHKETLDAI